MHKRQLEIVLDMPQLAWWKLHSYKTVQHNTSDAKSQKDLQFI